MLQLDQAHLLNISCFVVDATGELFYLRKRGEDSVPTAFIHHGTVTGRKIEPLVAEGLNIS